MARQTHKTSGSLQETFVSGSLLATFARKTSFMTSLEKPRPLLTCALRQEAAPFIHSPHSLPLSLTTPLSSAAANRHALTQLSTVKLFREKDYWLLVTGIGKDSTLIALTHVLSCWGEAISEIINIGTAGAITQNASTEVAKILSIKLFYALRPIQSIQPMQPMQPSLPLPLSAHSSHPTQNTPHTSQPQHQRLGHPPLSLFRQPLMSHRLHADATLLSVDTPIGIGIGIEKTPIRETPPKGTSTREASTRESTQREASIDGETSMGQMPLEDNTGLSQGLSTGLSKKILHTRFPFVDIVDMEGYWNAVIARQFAKPFHAYKIVSDGHDETPSPSLFKERLPQLAAALYAHLKEELALKEELTDSENNRALEPQPNRSQKRERDRVPQDNKTKKKTEEIKNKTEETTKKTGETAKQTRDSKKTKTPVQDHSHINSSKGQTGTNDPIPKTPNPNPTSTTTSRPPIPGGRKTKLKSEAILPWEEILHAHLLTLNAEFHFTQTERHALHAQHQRLARHFIALEGSKATSSLDQAQVQTHARRAWETFLLRLLTSARRKSSPQQGKKTYLHRLRKSSTNPWNQVEMRLAAIIKSGARLGWRIQIPPTIEDITLSLTLRRHADWPRAQAFLSSPEFQDLQNILEAKLEPWMLPKTQTPPQP